MPESELHQRRKQKNFVVMAMVLGFAALVFLTTILRMMPQ